MPNKFDFILSPNAEDNIDSALAYISENLANPKAAIDLLDELDKTIELACEFPFSSADCTCFLISDPNFRHVPVDHYTLVYEIDAPHERLNILFFRYSGMDITKILTDYEKQKCKP